MITSMDTDKNLTTITRMLPRFDEDTPNKDIENPFPDGLVIMF